MKKIVLIAFVALGSIACGSDDSDLSRTGWEGPDLYGDVKKVIATEYKITHKFGEEQRSITSISEYQFNSNGDVTVYTKHDASGNLLNKSEHEYSEDDSYYNYTNYDYTGYTPKCEVNKLTLDKKARTLKWMVYDSHNELIKWYDGTINENEDFKSIYEYCPSGSVVFAKKWFYDDDGVLIKHHEYDSNGDLEYKVLYSFHENERLSKKEYISVNSWTGETSLGGETYKYDSDDRLIEKSSKFDYFFGQKSETIRYKYDDDDKILEARTYEGDAEKLVSVTKYEVEYR